MKKYIILFVIIFSLFWFWNSLAINNTKTLKTVKIHSKKSGKVVRPYLRTLPNKIKSDNLNYKSPVKVPKIKKLKTIKPKKIKKYDLQNIMG